MLSPTSSLRALAVLSLCIVLGLVGTAHGQTPSILDGKTLDSTEPAAAKHASATTGATVPCVNGEAAGFPCDNVDLLSHLPITAVGAFENHRLNDLWGWTDPDTGHEYVLLGRTDGTAFVDVTNPEQPVYLGYLPYHSDGRPSVWRDIKTYANHAFIVADGAGNHGMQVFDLTQLRGRTLPTQFAATAHYGGIGSAHNIVINEETGFAYAVGASGGQSCRGGLHVIDIRQPTQPQFSTCFSDAGTQRGYTHDAQCVIYRGPDVEHQGKEICIGSNESAISIADVTDKDDTKSVAVATYPNAGYVHQGWMSEDHRYFFLDDEFDEARLSSGTRTIIWDLEDLDDPQVLTIHTSPITSIDHNQYVAGNLLYQANYTSGLRVLNISNPARPREVGFFDTYPLNDETRYSGAWSVYPFFESGTLIVSSIREGLFMMRLGASTYATSLASLEARPIAGGIDLQWAMDAERANSGFSIEVSPADAEVYTEVAFVPSEGDTDQPRNYHYELPPLEPGAYDVRLRLMAENGAAIYSDPVQVFVVPETHVLGTFPNPFADRLNVTLLLKQPQQVSVQVYDALGRQVTTLYDGPLAHDEAHRFDLSASNLPSGTYFVRIQGERFVDTREVTVVR